MGAKSPVARTEADLSSKREKRAAYPMYISDWNRKVISAPHGPPWPVPQGESRGALVPKFPGKREVMKPASCFATSLDEDLDRDRKWEQ